MHIFFNNLCVGVCATRPKCWELKINWWICAIAKGKQDAHSKGYRIIQFARDLSRFPLQALLEAGTTPCSGWVAWAFVQFGLGNLQGCKLHNSSTSGLLSWKCFSYICSNAHIQSVERVSVHQASGWVLSEHLFYYSYLQLFVFQLAILYLKHTLGFVAHNNLVGCEYKFNTGLDKLSKI